VLGISLSYPPKKYEPTKGEIEEAHAEIYSTISNGEGVRTKIGVFIGFI